MRHQRLLGCAPTLMAMSFMALGMLASAQVRETGDRHPISLRAVRQPMREVIPALARLSGYSLRVAPDLVEQKVIVIVRDQPASMVMSRLARVLGARWVREDGRGHTRFALERDPAVKQWLAFYDQQLWLAAKHARDEQTKFVRKFMDDMLSHANDPNWKPPSDTGTYDRGLAQLLNTLPPDALDAIAGQIGDGSPVSPGGIFSSGAPAVMLHPSDLSPAQRQIVNGWVNNNVQRFGAFGPRLEQQLDQTSVSFTCLDGVSVMVELNPPEKEIPDGHLAFTAFGASYDSTILAEFKHDDLKHRLSGHEMPPGALLGAHFDADGRPVPQVKTDAAFATNEVKLPDSNPQRWEFLVGLADTLRLNVIADYYTCSDRARLSSGPAKELLDRAADVYGTVFIEEDGWLLARREIWPEDDLAEIPAPLVEQWIAAKREGRGLAFDDIAQMALLTDDQLNALSVYQDGGVHFGNEVRTARFPANRSLLAAFAHLTGQQKRLAHSQSGVPLTAFPRDVEIEVIRRARLQIAGVVPGMAVRVRRHGLSERNPTPVDDLELLVPGSDIPVRLVTVFASR